MIDAYSFLINHVILRKGSDRYEDALALWDQALTLYPAYAALHAHKGSLLYRMKRRREAFELLDIAVQSGVVIADAYYHLGMCYLDGVGGREGGERGKASSLFKKALQLDPRHSGAEAALKIT